MNEHSPPETVVGSLSASDWQGNTLKYTIEHSKGYYIFDIQGTSLRLKFSPLLNSASKPGVTSPNNQYEVKVRCRDDGSPNMYRDKDFYITILDVNDTPYNLRVSSYSVKETASVNAVVGTLMANDDDGRSSDPHSPCSSWKVEDQSGAFKLKSPNQLVVARPIDHESQKIHPVTVTCVDYDHVSSSGRQRKTASTVINVVIQDAHEAPISTTLSHNDVDENTPVGTTIGTLTASDQDKESLTFSVSPTSYISGADARLFSLGSVKCSNPVNGNIRTTCTVDLKVKSKLDWEAIHLILKTPKLIIPALVCVRDTAGHIVCTTFQITIHNVNEAPTNIQLGSATLDENSPPNSVIGNILVRRGGSIVFNYLFINFFFAFSLLILIIRLKSSPTVRSSKQFIRIRLALLTRRKREVIRSPFLVNIRISIWRRHRVLRSTTKPNRSIPSQCDATITAFPTNTSSKISSSL